MEEESDSQGRSGDVVFVKAITLLSCIFLFHNLTEKKFEKVIKQFIIQSQFTID